MEILTNPATVFFAIAGLLISVFCFSYVLQRAFGKTYSGYVNIVGGVLCSPFIAIVALVVFVLDLLGAPDPLIK